MTFLVVRKPIYLSYYLVGLAMSILPIWNVPKLVLVVLTSSFITLAYSVMLKQTNNIWYFIHTFLIVLTEELVFRYFLMDVFFNVHIVNYPLYFNVILVSIIFALTHINRKDFKIEYIMMVFVAGLLYGSVYLLNGLEVAIFVHFVINVIIKCLNNGLDLTRYRRENNETI